MTDGSEPLTELTTADLVAIFVRAATAMRAHGPGLDALDVFPVADADTGVNLVAASTALAAAAAGSTSPAALASSLAGAQQSAARGRAGAMFGAFVVGFAEDGRNADRVDAERFALGLEAGALHARRSVGAPREGTMLSVIDAASTAAVAALDAGASLVEVLEAANEAGLDALERTPQQLSVLADAGVVDAGAAGWLVWLDAVLAHVVGDDGSTDAERPPGAGSGGSDGSDAVAGSRWEVGFRIDCDETAAATLAEVLASLGEVTTFAATPHGGPAGASWEVVVGVDDIGAAIEAALCAGRPRDIRVDDLSTSGRR